MTPGAPPATVLAAFGAAGQPVRLTGGRGAAWRVGNLVLKPLDISPAELAWQAQVAQSIRREGFRLATPLCARDGSLAAGGWSAWEFVKGRHEAGRWLDIIAAGERLHAAVAGLPWPDFLRARVDPWAAADRVAWGEADPERLGRGSGVADLLAARRPIAAANQVVHGDLTGNVLFADPLPPAIIDLAIYWRPAAYASAIVVADALVWEGADPRVFDTLGSTPDFSQHLIRALIFRIVAHQDPRSADRFLPTVALACRLAQSG